MSRRRTFLLLFCLGCVGLLRAAPKAPEWLTQAAARPIHVGMADAPALALEDYSLTEVQTDGRFRTHVRQAYRILGEEGRHYARSKIYYNVSTDQLRDLQAWLILPDGTVQAFRDKDFAQAESGNRVTLETETWSRSLDLKAQAIPGSLYAFSYTLTEAIHVPHLRWRFQQPIPVLHSELIVTTPPGWEVGARMINDPTCQYQRSGDRHQWLATQQPAHLDEADSPRDERDKFLAVRLTPPPGPKRLQGYDNFVNWAEMATHYQAIYDAAAKPDAAIRDKAQELTAAATSELEKIEAIARYVQAVPYTAITLKLASGGGYRPFPAAQSFARNWGDCKDKATLMRAMLASVGIPSYPVICLAEPKTAVHPDWPSPLQFNHCILAIQAPAEPLPSTVVDPALGRLLIFDPTMPYAPLGALPDRLEASRALILAPTTTELTLLPRLGSQLTDRLVGTLDAHGNLTGEWICTYGGEAANTERTRFSRRATRDNETDLLSRVRRSSAQAELRSWTTGDDARTNRFSLRLELAAPRHGKPLGPQRLLVAPFYAARTLPAPPTKAGRDRTLPLVLPLLTIEDTTELTLPEGFIVEELPGAVRQETPYGQLEASYQVEGNQLLARRTLHLDGRTVPAEAVPDVLAFYRAFAEIHASAVVLRRE